MGLGSRELPPGGVPLAGPFALLASPRPARPARAARASRRGRLPPEPYPDLVIASGRRAVPPILPALKAGERRACVHRLPEGPAHGPGRRPTSSWGLGARPAARRQTCSSASPRRNRVSSARLEAARAAPDPRLAGLRRPLVRRAQSAATATNHRFTDADQARLVADLSPARPGGRRAADDHGLAPARRRPCATASAGWRPRTGGFFLGRDGPRTPTLAILALADAVVVTADSAKTCWGEAAATGVPVLVFTPTGGHPKFEDARRRPRGPRGGPALPRPP